MLFLFGMLCFFYFSLNFDLQARTERRSEPFYIEFFGVCAYARV